MRKTLFLTAAFLCSALADEHGAYAREHRLPAHVIDFRAEALSSSLVFAKSRFLDFVGIRAAASRLAWSTLSLEQAVLATGLPDEKAGQDSKITGLVRSLQYSWMSNTGDTGSNEFASPFRDALKQARTVGKNRPQDAAGILLLALISTNQIPTESELKQAAEYLGTSDLPMAREAVRILREKPEARDQALRSARTALVGQSEPPLKRQKLHLLALRSFLESLGGGDPQASANSLRELLWRIPFPFSPMLHQAALFDGLIGQPFSSPEEVGPGDLVVYRKENLYVLMRVETKSKGAIYGEDLYELDLSLPILELRRVSILSTIERPLRQMVRLSTPLEIESDLASLGFEPQDTDLSHSLRRLPALSWRIVDSRYALNAHYPRYAADHGHRLFFDVSESFVSLRIVSKKVLYIQWNNATNELLIFYGPHGTVLDEEKVRGLKTAPIVIVKKDPERQKITILIHPRLMSRLKTLAIPTTGMVEGLEYEFIERPRFESYKGPKSSRHLTSAT
jgi:hypothetical protein